MPVFTAIAAAVVTAIGVTGFWAAVVTFAVKTLAVAVVSSLLLRPKSGGGSANVSGSRVQVPPATNNKLPVSYGTAYLSPVITDAKISTDQKYMWYCMALCEVTDTGTISYDDPNNPGYPYVQWGDKTLTFDSTNKWVVKSSSDSNGGSLDYADDEFHVYLYNNGSYSGQYSAPNAITVMSDTTTGGGIDPQFAWTTTDTMYKTAFAIVRIKYNSDKNITGLSQLTALVSNTLTKPGDVLVDYLTNDRYGCGMSSSLVNTAAFTELNSYSDELISYTPAGGGTASKARYRVNGPVDTSRNCLSNLYELCDNFDSWLQWNETLGKWSVVINRSYSQAGQTFDDLFVINSNNIIGGVDVVPMDVASTYTRIEAQFPSALIKDQADVVNIDLDQFPTYPRNPNEPDNVLNLTFHQTNDSVRPQYLSIRKLLQSRKDLIVNLSMDYSGIQVDAGDIVRVNHEWYGWTDKLFRVTQVQEVLTQDGILGARLTLSEYDDSIYATPAITAYSAASATGISDPSIISQPSAPTFTNVISQATVPSYDVVGVVPTTGGVTSLEYWYATSSSGAPADSAYTMYGTQNYGGSVYPNGYSDSITVSGIPAGTYYWKIRAVSGSGSKSSFSAASSSFVWNPAASSDGGTSFVAIANPNPITIPTNGGTPIYTGATTQLTGYIGSTAIDFVLASSDSDSSFTNNTWRIGGSSTTGLGSIVKTNITIADPTDGGNYAQFAAPSAISGSLGVLTVPVRYKNSSGVVLQASSVTIQYTVQASSSTLQAAGSNTQVQFNNSGVLGASSGFTFSGGDITVSNNIRTAQFRSNNNSNTATNYTSQTYANSLQIANISPDLVSITARGTGTAPVALGVDDVGLYIGSYGYSGNGVTSFNGQANLADMGGMSWRVAAVPTSNGNVYSSNVLIQSANTTSNTRVTMTFDSAGNLTVPSFVKGNVLATTAPATSSSTGVAGQIAYANGYVYICVATNTWQRAALSTF